MEIIFTYIGGLILILFGIIAYFLKKILDKVEVTYDFVILQKKINEDVEIDVKKLQIDVSETIIKVNNLDINFSKHIQEYHK